MQQIIQWNCNKYEINLFNCKFFRIFVKRKNMQTIKIEIILSHANGPILGCPIGTTKDIDSLIESGYLLEIKGGFTKLTDKGISLVETIELASEVFENAHSVRKDTVDTLNSIKDNTNVLFDKIRNNTGDFLHKMAETLKNDK